MGRPLHLRACRARALRRLRVPHASLHREDWRDVLHWYEHPRDADQPKSYRELRERLRLPPDTEHPGE
jgi:hypothetical protein